MGVRIVDFFSNIRAISERETIVPYCIRTSTSTVRGYAYRTVPKITILKYPVRYGTRTVR